MTGTRIGHTYLRGIKSHAWCSSAFVIVAICSFVGGGSSQGASTSVFGYLGLLERIEKLKFTLHFPSFKRFPSLSSELQSFNLRESLYDDTAEKDSVTIGVYGVC